MSVQDCPGHAEGHRFTPGDPPEWLPVRDWDNEAWDAWYDDAVWYCEHCGISEEDA
jgi:hypothetical protein